jgi:S-adenosylmethionine synthetase
MEQNHMSQNFNPAKENIHINTQTNLLPQSADNYNIANNTNTDKRLKDYQFTSEAVGPGHPDKLCDQMSDALVDLYLSHDPYSRVAIETIAIPNKVIVAGEVRGHDNVTNELITQTIRNVIKKVGYTQDKFHWNTIEVDINLNHQSPDIAMGVDGDENKDEGAGDQGIMFGFACNETNTLMPAPLFYSHNILEGIFNGITNSEIAGLGPDAKSQVTIQYKNGKPVCASKIVVSIQHSPNFTQSQVKEMIKPYVQKSLPDGWMCDDEHFFVNPTGRFVIGGPEGDTGLTGRKIIVDTYGGAAPHGGGAFSGKDPTKVDRSAAYIARYLAKNVVASGIANKCTIQLSYAIGLAQPMSFYVNTHGTSACNEDEIAAILRKYVDLRPQSIRERLQLNRPIYQRTATFGHFGHEPTSDGGYSWEKTDLIEILQKELGNK